MASLLGYLHGEENEACLHMLERISRVEHIPKFINKIKDKKRFIKLIGFGYRIYKNYDPRAIVLC